MQANTLTFLRAFTGAFSPDPSGNLWAPVAAAVPATYFQLFEASPPLPSALLTPESGRRLIASAEDLYRGLYSPNRFLPSEQIGRPGALFSRKAWRIGQTPDGLEVSTSQFESDTSGIVAPSQLSDTLGFTIDNPIERRRVGFSCLPRGGLLADVTLASDRGSLFQRVAISPSGESSTVQYSLFSRNPAAVLGKTDVDGGTLLSWMTDFLANQFWGETIRHVAVYREFPNGISKPLFENPLEAGAALYASPLIAHLEKALAGRWTLCLVFFMRPDFAPRWAQKITLGKSKFSLDLSNPPQKGLWPLWHSACDFATALRCDIEEGYPVSRNVN